MIKNDVILFHSNSKIWTCDTNSCVVVSVEYLLKSYIKRYYHVVSIKKIKDQSCNAQNRRSGEMANILFYKYKNHVIPHSNRMFKTPSDMDMTKMCAYP